MISTCKALSPLFRARALGLLAWQDRSKMIPTDLWPWPCLRLSSTKGLPHL